MRLLPILLFCLTLLLFLVSVYLSLTNPVSQTSVKLGLSQSMIPRALLNLSFSIPLFTSFFFGLWAGLLLFKGKEFRFFAVGILVLTLVLMAGNMISSIRTHFFPTDIYGMYKVLTIVINLIYSFGYLLGFYLLFGDVRRMLPEGKNKWNVLVSAVVVLLIGTFYTLMLFTNPDRTITTTADIKPTHFLSDWLIFLTIALPSWVAWFFAVLAAFSLADLYSQPANSSRAQGLKNLLYGVIFLLSGAITIQVILSIGTTRFVEAGLIFILAIIYIFALVLAIGNFLIFKGAKKLSGLS